jgi:hypothetical protein
MAIPALFFGHADSGMLMKVGEGYTDNGTPYVPVLVSVPAALGGTVGESVISAVYLTLDQRREPVGDEPAEEASLVVTPIVDGAEMGPYEVTVRMVEMNETVPPARLAKTYEVGVSQPWFRDGSEVARFSPRGRFFQLRVELPATDIRLAEAQVEFEPLLESGRAVNDSRGE